MKIERVLEPSHIRRGRLATSPTFFVTTDAGVRWRFLRKKDAAAFVVRGGCPNHDAKSCVCDECHGHVITQPAKEE